MIHYINHAILYKNIVYLRKKMPYAYKKKNTPGHFQRQESRNIGICLVSENIWFIKGYIDYYEGIEEHQDFGEKTSGFVKIQTAYELGRLFAAYMKGIDSNYYKPNKMYTFFKKRSHYSQILPAQNDL